MISIFSSLSSAYGKTTAIICRFHVSSLLLKGADWYILSKSPQKEEHQKNFTITQNFTLPTQLRSGPLPRDSLCVAASFHLLLSSAKQNIVMAGEAGALFNQLLQLCLKQQQDAGRSWWSCWSLCHEKCHLLNSSSYCRRSKSWPGWVPPHPPVGKPVNVTSKYLSCGACSNMSITLF